MCCHGQHATTTGAKCTSETRKLRGGFPKTDLGLGHQYRYRTGTKRRQRKQHGQTVTWYECYDDKCFVHVQEKIQAVYYPQENGERKPLSRWHRNHPEPGQQRNFRAVRTQPRREESEKTQPDVGALQRQIQELLDEKQQSLERDAKSRQELANYQNTIGRMREEIQGLR